MVGALGKALAQAGHQVGIVTPLYTGIRERYPALKSTDLHLDIPLGMIRVRGEVWSLQSRPGLTLYFVDQPEFYQRSTLYSKYGVDYVDNAERFMFFSKAIAHLALHLPWKPQLVHLNDWQTGFAALFLHLQRKLPGWESTPRTCMTIHNLAYQGLFPLEQYTIANLSWDYFAPNGVEFYGKTNCLKAGIVFADMVTTVSPRYAREITTEEFGCGLDPLLRYRQSSLTGILNGVDYEEWNTINNAYIARPYSSDRLEEKTANKVALQREYGLPEAPDVPLFGSIGRLVDQKGVDIMLMALEETLQSGLQFVLLGTGLPVFEQSYQDLAKRFPGQVSVRIGFDEGLSHRIEAGCDFFLMPSRFEPCGLNQMYSLRYATLPIVRATGGLDDTVTDPREDPGNANGIKFNECSDQALAKGIRKALALYKEPELFRAFQKNAIAADFSWTRTAEDYVGTYQKACRNGESERISSPPER